MLLASKNKHTTNLRSGSGGPHSSKVKSSDAGAYYPCCSHSVDSCGTISGIFRNFLQVFSRPLDMFENIANSIQSTVQ